MFWQNTFREVNLYCRMRLIKLQDDFKKQVILQEATTNKMIQSDPMLYERPKIIPLQKVFSPLFKKE